MPSQKREVVSAPDPGREHNRKAFPEGLPETVRRWVTFAHQLIEPRQRAMRLTERLLSLPPEGFVDALDYILQQAQKGSDAFMGVLDALARTSDALADKPPWYVQRVLDYARERGKTILVNFLRRPPLEPGLNTEFHPDPNQLANEVTLGERKALAFSRDPNVIDRLLFDPEPGVIQKLLLNPRLTLRHVVRIASRRPNRPEILREVFQSPRWGVQYDVKLTLARNPYTAPELALRLLPILHAQDLRDIGQDAVLGQDVRTAAEALLVEREKAE